MNEPWSKFFWSDYDADEGLRVCSLAAQGLWMRMLCLMARATPKGDLRIGGEPCTANDLARAVGESEVTVEKLLEELRRRGVSSTTRAGVIFSRRLRKDAEISRKRAESGRKGGMASLGKQKEIEICLTKPQANEEANSKPQKPEARDQIDASASSAPEIDLVDLASRIATVSGVPLPDPMRNWDRHNEHMGLVSEWIGAGADPDMILKTVGERAAAARTPPKSWQYFRAAVLEAAATRAAGQSKVDADTDALMTEIIAREKLKAVG